MLHNCHKFRSYVPHANHLSLLAILLVCVSGCVSSNESTLKPIKMDTPKDVTPSVQTLYSLARLYMAQDETEKGEAVLFRIISDYPEFTPAYSDLAKLRLKQGRVDDSIAVLNGGISVNKNDPVLYNNLGLSQMLNTDYETALASFASALEIDPRKERYIANKALAYGLMGNIDQSYATYRKIMSEEDTWHNIELIGNMRGSDSSQLDAEVLVQGIVEYENKNAIVIEDLQAIIEEESRNQDIVDDLQAIIANDENTTEAAADPDQESILTDETVNAK